jgi:pSer/pThr/pTyr-binding forkhead associated (FHA) protein
VCTCGELNNPDAEACRACGAHLDRGLPRRRGPRPPLGILITDDGRVFTLTDDVVVGREPAQAPEVRAGRARPLVLRDTDQSTSRVHAQIRLSGWRVEVVDRGSSNGTFLSRSGPAGPWLPVPRGEGLVLAPGDRLRLGKRELLFDRYQAFQVKS